MSVISAAEVELYTSRLNALTGAARESIASALSRIEYDSVADLRLKLFDAMEPFIVGSTDVAASLAAEFYDSVREQAVGERYGASPSSGYDQEATEGAIRALLDGIVKGGTLEDIMGDLLDRADWEIKHAAGNCVIENADKDPLSKRYARIPAGDETCDFCLMLASRGFDYLSAKSAGADRRGHYHPNCDCRIVPGFDGMEVEGYDPDELYIRFSELSEGFDDKAVVEEYNAHDEEWQRDNPFDEFKTRKLMAHVRKRRNEMDAAEKTPQIVLPKKEYGRVVSAINNAYHARYEGEPAGIICVGDYRYSFKVNDFDDYVITKRQELT